MKLLLAFLLSFSALFVAAQKPDHHYVSIETSYGTCLLKLYDETPLHKQNFIKLVKEGYYEDLLFHRVIQNFMIQGGDPDSRFAADTQVLGNGGPEYKIPAEIQKSLIHRKGTIGAARDNNPEKASSGSQFYLVQGHVFTNAGLDSLEEFRLKGEKLTSLQREVYTSVGGTPHLDGNYTVFGELIDGLEVVDQIAAQETDDKDRPKENVQMKMHLLTRREALNLEREMEGLSPKNGFFTRLLDGLKSRDY